MNKLFESILNEGVVTPTSRPEYKKASFAILDIIDNYGVDCQNYQAMIMMIRKELKDYYQGSGIYFTADDIADAILKEYIGKGPGKKEYDRTCYKQAKSDIISIIRKYIQV
jgi:hypothetical protein